MQLVLKLKQLNLVSAVNTTAPSEGMIASYDNNKDITLVVSGGGGVETVEPSVGVEKLEMPRSPGEIFPEIKDTARSHP